MSKTVEYKITGIGGTLVAMPFVAAIFALFSVLFGAVAVALATPTIAAVLLLKYLIGA